MSNSTEYKITLSKIWIHLKTICKHKFWVMYYCFKCGIPWQGIIHDLSKFSFTEFWTNVKYVIPGKSPIDVQKENIGFSMAWQHHKGHNPHHYEFWMDKFDDGCYVTRMPFKYALEMLCDNLAAGKAYQGKNFSYKSEYHWWEKQRAIRNMHPANAKFLETAFKSLYDVSEGKTVTLDFNKETFELKSVDDILNHNIMHKMYTKAKKETFAFTQVKIKQPGEDIWT